MKTKTLDHVESELCRFLLALRNVREIEAKNEERVANAEKKGERWPHIDAATRKHGAMRRAAHDLKNSLTLITQNKDVE